MGNFVGKVALVAGAGTGIGRASAIVFAREGAKVVVADVEVGTGEETVRLIQEAGGEAVFFAVDVENGEKGRREGDRSNIGVPSFARVSLHDQLPLQLARLAITWKKKRTAGILGPVIFDLSPVPP